MSSSSPYPSIDVPEVDIFELLFENPKPFPDSKVIYADPLSDRHYTFGQVKESASSFGHALVTQWNWTSGDVLGTFAANSIDTPVVTFGTLWATGVVSPANPGYSAKELSFQLINSGAKALVTQAHLLKVAFEAAELAKIPRNRILLLGDERLSSVPHFREFSTAANGANKALRRKQHPSAPAFIPYSSGTTGLPKGVLLTQHNIVSNLCQLDITLFSEDYSWQGGPSGQGDCVLAVLPLYHIYGLVLLIHHTIFRGIKTVVMSSFAQETFLQTIQKHKVTVAFVVPPILLFLSKHPAVDNYDLSSVRWLGSAAAPCGKQLIQDVYNRLKIPVLQAYGSTETSPGTHSQKPSEWNKPIGSVGKLLPNLTAKYVSEAGEYLPKGSTGELWVKGPNVFSGYFNNPTATAGSLTSDGYYKTGDIAYEDENGNLFITDRLKELIKYKGFQVPPAELEALLLSYEKVSDACVIGIHDESQATELPLAFIVKAPAFASIDDKTLADDIVAWVASQVANHKRLRGGVRFVETIPKSPAGKILRRLVRDQITAEQKKLKPKL